MALVLIRQRLTLLQQRLTAVATPSLPAETHGSTLSLAETRGIGSYPTETHGSGSASSMAETHGSSSSPAASNPCLLTLEDLGKRGCST